MKRTILAPMMCALLSSCVATPELDNAAQAVTVQTSGGYYSVIDASDTRTMKVTTQFGQGTEIAVWQAAEKYLRDHRPGCEQTDRIEMSDGFVTNGIYMVKYKCAASPAG